MYKYREHQTEEGIIEVVYEDKYDVYSKSQTL